MHIMLKKSFIILSLLGLIVTCTDKKVDLVCLDSLLDEMVSFEENARYPAIPYTCHQESSYDRRSVSPDRPGWFANNDGFGIIRIDTIEGRKENVLFDQSGPGVITRIWLTTLDKRGKMRFYFDHSPEAQWEIPAYDLMQTGLPLGKGLLQAHTSYTTEGKGGNTLFLPIPYSKGCKITFELSDGVEPTPKYYQINYRKYPVGTSVQTFSVAEVEKLKDKIEKVSNDLIQPADYTQGNKINILENIAPQQSINIELPAGNQAVYTMHFNIQADSTVYEELMRHFILQMIFDGKQTVSVPLGDFSAGGTGAREVKSWFLSSDGKGNITSRWVMPYQERGSIELVNTSSYQVHASVTVYTDHWVWDERSLYFHASWKEEKGLYVSQNYDNDAECSEWNFAFLSGGRGVYKGDVLSLFNHTPAWYGEGDEKIWVDDDTFPSHFGTGTEDYYNSSWAPVIPFQTPFGGAPRADLESSHGYNTFFRTRNLDGIPFKSQLNFQLELLSWNSGNVDYDATVYWYGDIQTTESSK